MSIRNSISNDFGHPSWIADFTLPNALLQITRPLIRSYDFSLILNMNSIIIV